MAWRPTHCLIEGELDNTMPGRVTGWMRFAGMGEKVTFDLQGDFHRDIRGAKVRLKGTKDHDNARAASYMQGFALQQAGKVGDMTSGRPPQDYVAYGYFEWYSEANGRVVLELDPEQVEVIGRPIPWIESDPVSRTEQAQNMGDFLAGLCRELGAQTAGDPAFDHWVLCDGQIIGEARDVEAPEDGLCFAYVRLHNMPEMAEYGSIEAERLRPKAAAAGKAGGP